MQILLDFIGAIVRFFADAIVLVWDWFWSAIMSLAAAFLTFLVGLLTSLLEFIPDGFGDVLGPPIMVAGEVLHVANVYVPIVVLVACLYGTFLIVGNVWLIRLVIKLIPTVG